MFAGVVSGRLCALTRAACRSAGDCNTEIDPPRTSWRQNSPVRLCGAPGCPSSGPASRGAASFCGDPGRAACSLHKLLEGLFTIPKTIPEMPPGIPWQEQLDLAEAGAPTRAIIQQWLCKTTTAEPANAKRNAKRRAAGRTSREYLPNPSKRPAVVGEPSTAGRMHTSIRSSARTETPRSDQ
jgi:hypothetical protein